MRFMMKQMLALVVLIVLVGCNLSYAQDVSPEPSSTVPVIKLAQAEGTPVPTVGRDLHPVATPEPETTESPAEVTPEAPLPPLPIQYTVLANIDFQQKGGSVEQMLDYTNTTGETLDDILFDVQANNWVNGFSLNSITVDNTELAYELNGNRLDVQLAEPLRPDETLHLALSFKVQTPKIAGGIFAMRGFFGHTDRQFNLGNWLPTMAPRKNGEWQIHTPIFIGEQIVVNQADWDVTLTVTGASDSLTIAAPGTIEQIRENRWHIVLPRARDFALSMSESFNMLSRETEDGVTVEVYSYDDAVVATDDGPKDASAHTLLLATRSIDMYSDLFGPFPYKRMVVIQGDFPDGMEFSGLVFVGNGYFQAFTGEPTGYLTLITVHEIAHQWWYVRVGNDSALHPWLDEALATYSEYIYFEEFYPVLKDWWWTFRVNNYFPSGAVDSTVYEFSASREYINAVYLRGVLMLHAIREDIGTEEFFDILYRYAQAGDGKIVEPNLFWSLFSPAQLDLTKSTRAFYLRQPEQGQ